jgi:anti-sigma-K factor RskA
VTDGQGDEREKLSAEVRAALTPAAVRAGTRARLLARAAADARARGIDPLPATSQASPALSLSRGRGVPIPVFGVVALALAASVVFAVKLKNDSSADRMAFAAADRAAVQRIDSLRTLVVARDDLVASLTGAQVRVVGLSAGETKAPRALMFWDKSNDRWTFVAHNLAPLATGRTYQLWLVTASKKISAGTFTVTPAGDAFVRATFALDRNALKAVAVTEEPAGGVPQPTGAMVVVGTASTQ